MAIIAEIQTLVKRLYEQYGTDGTDDETLIADLEALMHELWQKYGPGSDINKDFTVAWRDLLTKYGVDSAAVEDEVCLAFVIGENQQRKAVDGVSVRVRDATKPDMPLLQYLLDEGSNQLVLQRPASANGITANAIASVLIANATTASSFDLELTVHDLSATHRVYKGWDGQKWLDIIVHNYAAFGDNPKLTCAVYVDGAGEPYYVNLPYYDQSIANRTTQTISMPLSALVDDPSAHSRARVEVKVVGREECALVNNEFTVYLGGKTVWIPVITVVYRCFWL